MKAFRLSLSLSLLLYLAAPLSVQAAEETVTFDTPEQSELYHALLREYRCLKCQNQNLADSHASLASDLRREIRGQILEGNGKAEIDAYLVARYGEFVFYRPRFSSKTAILWLGPFVLLLVGLAAVYVMIRRRATGRARQIAELEASAAEDRDQAARLARARQLLDD
ncbi:cytochrome c-type biogenesis protein [Granulosicoccus sp. 3-233]|uniref:cytochrome c-type biogenesis protein n=1 Tax=Granulosicoccus sp. 3-233 TaxID=3417969 RepID=UPI003D34BFCB